MHQRLSGRASCTPLSPQDGTVVFSGHPGRVPYNFECSSSTGTQSSAQGLATVFLGRLDLCDETGLSSFEIRSSSTAPDLVREAYQKWGAEEFPAHLYGDFAIVLWDCAARRLVLTRSPSGLYPLFYTHRGAELQFATTPHAMLGNDSARPDEQALAEWLVLRPRLSDHSMFAGVRRVSPGTSVLLEQGRVRIVRHWRPEQVRPLHLRNHREYADALRETLQAAINDRLCAAPGPIASQLSGGLDSSSVTALAAEQLARSGQTLLAYTAVPGHLQDQPVADRFFDESGHASSVAAQYGNVVHTCVSAGENSLLETLDRYTDAEAVPPFNPHHLQWIDATYAAAAGDGATTLLTGSMGNTTISANGVFATADALQRGRFLKAARLFGEARASGVRKLGHIPGSLLAAYLPRVLDLVDHVRKTRFNAEEFTGVRPRFAEANGIDLSRWDRRLPFRTARQQALDAIDRFDFGMFHESPRRLYGLNATDPTFDRRVVELTLSIPLEQFIHNGVPRALIRTAMEGRLPDVVRLERRRGLQSADFLTMLEREREAIAQELDRMRSVDLLCRAFDIPLLQERLRWTPTQAIAYGWYQYSNRLMRALSAGRFIRRMLDGSLFSTEASMERENEHEVLIRL